ncbi:MAG: xanthine dehydrogenase family protein subunit M [Dehalococcoidia bacterium]|nr:xanthine dehydrogenase family protein subunit M [Dehalococcoidia bacterium]MDW8119087.1 xanthine dehydrogenase family protein subunit M [Chloroflexota bacterium]
MVCAPFTYHRPASVRQAVALLQRLGDDAKVLAGGQSLIPTMKLRLAQPQHLIDLAGIPSLSYVKEGRGIIRIGALTTHAEVESSEVLKRRLPVLAETASLIGDMQVRNRGTIGGSVAHADPAADYPATLLALDARFRVVGPQGTRFIPASAFFKAPFTTALEAGEILTEVQVPVPAPRTGASYQKFANKASRFAVVGVCAFLALTARGTIRQVRIGVTGAADHAFRATAAEGSLVGQRPTGRAFQQAARVATEGVECISDVHGSAEYRAWLCQVLTRRALETALARASA